MTAQVSVVVRVDGPAPWLTALAASLDAQTLGYDDFETVLVLAEPGGPTHDRVADFARHRPNVRVVTGELVVAEHLQGRWVVDLGDDLDERRPELFPQALGQLVAFGETHGCAAVLGRAQVRGRRVLDRLFARDTGELAADVLGSLTGPAPLIAVAAQVAAQVGTCPRLPDVPGAVGALGDHPVVLISGPVDADEQFRVAEAVGHWVDGTLELRAILDPPATPDAAPVLHLRHAKTYDELALPTRVEQDGARPVVVAALDVRAATADGPLPDGPWELHLVQPGDTSAWIEPAPVPPLPGPLPSAAIGGLLVASTRRQDRQVVDVAATAASVVGKVPIAAGSVAESARGSLLTLRLDDLSVLDAGAVRGQLFLGSLVLPVDLVSDGDSVRLQSWVSGLPATLPVHTRFGIGPRTATGLALQIDGDGAMAVVAEPPKPEKAVSTKPQPAPRRPSLTQRVTTRVPEPLRPAVRTVARNPYAQRAYRAVRARRAKG
ncbi:hypothetical protein [uncultured Jatrophihabitans sp.]|uniref:hypothetical protein n=1 Tax=uncultured Jatrophihabitans sp. TaxID=1610747 RepID=UPI0035CB2A10